MSVHRWPWRPVRVASNQLRIDVLCKAADVIESVSVGNGRIRGGISVSAILRAPGAGIIPGSMQAFAAARPVTRMAQWRMDTRRIDAVGGVAV